jgi:NitT/TauT family transport system substrate-binding protein
MESIERLASGSGLIPASANGDFEMRYLRGFVLALTASFAACFAFISPPPALADGKKAVISQAFQSMLYLPLYVGIDQGFFTAQGLDLEKQTAGSPTVALNAVISKSAEFSLHGPEWTAIAASKGAQVGIIANVVSGAAVWIAATPDFKFDSIKDLKGEKVVTGTMPTTSTSLFIKLLKENGMDANTDVEMIQVPIGSEPGPFMAKQAKVAVMYEPGVDQVVAKGMKVVVGFPKLYGPYAFSAITTRRDVDPDAAQRLVKGLEMALRFMPANEARTIEIAKAEFPSLDPAVVEAAVKRMIADGVYPNSVDITADALKISMNTQIALGNLAAQPDYATFVDRTFIVPALAMK